MNERSFYMKSKRLILILILILAFFLRVVNIQSSPPSLYGDELTIALDANALLHTGMDQLGNFLPLTFPMGAGRPAGYVYASIPFIAIFGQTELGVRMLSILSGVGIVFLLYLLSKKLFSKEVGIAAAFLAALSPWDINLSRAGFEAHFALFLSLLGIYLLILAKQKAKFFIFSAICLVLAFHTYPTYKLALPLIIPFILWFNGWFKNIHSIRDKFYFRRRELVHLTIAILILGFLGLLAAIQTISGGSETRFSNINIFSQDRISQQIEQKINFERSSINLPGNISKYFHNKPVEYVKVFFENYLQNFSLDFLVIHGDRNPRHNMATMGQIYFVELILFFIGLLSFWQKNRKVLIALLCWLILAPIPTAIIDLPHALRSSLMLPPLIIISSLGLYTIFNQKKILSFIIFVLLIQFLFFVQKLYFLAPSEYSSFWSYGGKVATDIANKSKSEYKYVILSDQIDSIEFAYPVYSNLNPDLVISQNETKARLGEYYFKKFENVYIGFVPVGKINEFVEKLDGSVLYIGNNQIAKNLKSYETIIGPDRSEILTLRKINKN